MKLRLLRILCLAALVSVLPVSCREDGPEDYTAEIIPRTDELEPSAGSIFVTVTAAADWSITLEYPEGTEEWASVEPASGTGSRGDVRLRYGENGADAPRKVTMVLKPARGLAAKASVSQKGLGGEESGGYGEDVSRAGWLELPATVAGDGRELLVHDMKGGKYRNAKTSGVRNWSCYWDYENRVSVWVAYPLNASLIGSGDRSNAWGYDPLLPQDLQQSITTSFSTTKRYYSDPLYDRGHQIPSADRLNYSANVSTFYPTNMTPQSGPFNSGIWAGLEGAVRGYAKQTTDTLYVVTGCVIDNTQTYVRDVAGHSIAVPTAYFKALLFHGQSTYATQGYMAAGFLLPHSDGIANASYKNYICSIDELEKKTGFDFFPALEQLVGKETADKIEAAEPSNWWK